MTHRLLSWVAGLPWLVLLLAYAWLGWLSPAHWLGEPQDVLAQSQPLARGTGRSGGAGRERAPPRPAPPWPDEGALRLQLAGRGLRLTGFQLGPQRQGAAEVRLTLQWQGRLLPALDMLQTLAMDWPQMALDALVLQALPQAQWQVVWRGQWQHLTAPDPLQPRPEALSWTSRVGGPPLDEGVLRQRLARLWPLGIASAQVLRLLRPEDIQLVAVLHQPDPVAWLNWQQQTLVVRPGDRIGAAGARVKSIMADEVVIEQSGRLLRVRPVQTTVIPEVAP